MPRLTKEDSAKYQAGLAEWTPKVLEVIQKIAKISDNKVKRSEILIELGEYFEERLVNPIFNKLFASGHICKTGSARGRGARWGIPDNAPEELVVSDLVTNPSKPQITRAIKIAGPYANFASGILRARAPQKASVAIVESEDDADYIANTGDSRRIKHWYLVFMRKFA